MAFLSGSLLIIVSPPPSYPGEHFRQKIFRHATRVYHTCFKVHPLYRNGTPPSRIGSHNFFSGLWFGVTKPATVGDWDVTRTIGPRKMWRGERHRTGGFTHTLNLPVTSGSCSPANTDLLRMRSVSPCSSHSAWRAALRRSVLLCFLTICASTCTSRALRSTASLISPLQALYEPLGRNPDDLIGMSYPCIGTSISLFW
jgi:hypothetical protein